MFSQECIHNTKQQFRTKYRSPLYSLHLRLHINGDLHPLPIGVEAVALGGDPQGGALPESTVEAEHKGHVAGGEAHR